MKQLNWLTNNAGSLCASLLLIQAATSSAIAHSNLFGTTSNPAPARISQSNSNLLIAIGKKKPRQKKVKRTVKIKATRASSLPPIELTRTPSPTPAPPVPPAPDPVPTPPLSAPTPNPPKVETLSQFSTTSKLRGEVIFGVTGNISGDFSRNTTFGHRTRLELQTVINGNGLLLTRLQATGQGLFNQNSTAGTTATATPEGSLSWTDGTTTSSLGIDALRYEFPLTPQTKVVIAANEGAADDFTDPINPYFNGDSAHGSISAFGRLPSIYYTTQGAGVGIQHKLCDKIELSLGYLARNASKPASGTGLFGSGYGALAQLTFQTGANSKVGATYTRTFNSDFGTGSTNANLGGLSNNFGLEGSFQLSPQLTLGGWAGYAQNQVAGSDGQIWNWAITAAAPNLGGKGNLAGLLIGQEPRVASASNGTADTKAGLHIEGFYEFKVSDNLSITPGIIYLTAPNQDVNSRGAVIGVLRTAFDF